MARRDGSPADGAYSHFRCEEATITNVNRNTWKVSVSTTHSAKDVDDLKVMVPYTHYNNGEGYHHMPEVGAKCYLAWPSDDTPPFIMGYVADPSAVQAANAPDSPEEEAAFNDFSYRNRRPQLNPGDISITGRDGNFVTIHRGGIVSIGATAICQRIFIPTLNYIKDFGENYALTTLGGDMTWTVEREENDADGDAPSQMILHMNAHAQDEKATLRIRHMPLQDPSGSPRSAYDIVVASKNIDRDTGEVTDEKYSMLITVDGDKTELVGGTRKVTVKGNDELVVEGSRSADISGTDEVGANEIKYVAQGSARLDGATVKLGGAGANQASLKGNDFVNWLMGAQFIDGMGNVSTLMPVSVPGLQLCLSRKVVIE